MYIVTIKAKLMSTGTVRTCCIESGIPLAIADVRESMLENGWLTLGVWNDQIAPDKIYG